MAARDRLWLLLAAADDPGTPYAAATLAWLAREHGASFEMYAEARREGSLFARTGSTVLGGGHHAGFNLLFLRFEVTVFVLGVSEVFGSTVAAAGLAVGGRADTAAELVAQVLESFGGQGPEAVLVGPASAAGDTSVAPYLYPEIVYRRAVGVPVTEVVDLPESFSQLPILAACLSPGEYEQLPEQWEVETVETALEHEGHGPVTLRIARRWQQRARGVGFGDPIAVLAQLPRFVREDRVAVYSPTVPLPPAQLRWSAYTEQRSGIADDVAHLALALDNPVVVGRQTCDGDLFTWSRSGIAMQITEPERPAFPILATAAQPWSSAPGFAVAEPTDDELLAWAYDGVVLTSLLWHSGEIAHNEAMLNLIDLAGATGVKMGVGVHAERYETSPQQWELLAISQDRGGVRGLIEPLLHSGGRGVLAEAECPPEALTEHCLEALSRIRSVTGEDHTPIGYLAFCDTDLTTLAPGPARVYEAVARAGISYAVSSAVPGRNRIVWSDDDMVVLNQSARSVAQASPFIRVTTVEELREDVAPTPPGWVLATLDAPVIAFDPYIWRHGSRFMKIVDWLTSPGESDRRRNVLPSTVARYARLLAREGFLPPTPIPARGEQ